jgi:peptide-methionine (S)-S-oxide reductase
MTTQTAIFAAGCFWGVEDTFRKIPGVQDAISGYTGGSVERPSYEQVCTGSTGHAEAVQVTFDPSIVSYDALLTAFWNMHNPTQHNRQGPDIGTQYRSAIFYNSPEQRAQAERSRDEIARSRKYTAPIATEITAASTFWNAEEYHQRYAEKHGGAACHI